MALAIVYVEMAQTGNVIYVQDVCGVAANKQT